MFFHEFSDEQTEVNFLAGGIGTGCFSVGSRGQFRDFEVFGNPGKGNFFPYFFFSIFARTEGEDPVVRVLESEFKEPFSRSHGFGPESGAGLARLEKASMRVRFPFCEVAFEDSKLPVEVKLEVSNPFIPLDLRDSSFPAVFLSYRVKNPGTVPAEVTVAGNLPNMSGVKGFQREAWEGIEYADFGTTEFVEESGLSGFFCEASKLAKEDRHYGNLALLTPDEEITRKNLWLNRGNWDGLNEFWQDFSEDGRLEPDPVYTAKNAGRDREYQISSLGVCKTVAPGETEEFQFLFSWFYPMRDGNWYGGEDKPVALHFTNYFKDAADAAVQMYENRDWLMGKTREFTDALYGSTLPEEALDAIGANLFILRSPVCFLLKDGTFLSWEGCFKTSGCCEGNCTHVYNYAQTLAYLFPELERSMGRTSFLLETGEHGQMAFRTQQVFGNEKSKYHPAVDGQMGTLIRLYRDWKLTGDDGYVKEVWEKAKAALEFALVYWDSDGDFVLDSQQHNTYDIEFYHPNSLANSMFLGALRAAVRIAEYLGDGAAAERYGAIFKACSEKIDQLLWGGEYYIQAIGDVDEYVYQYGTGCLADQILGQSLALAAGLGYILPEEKVRLSIESVYRYNFKKMDEHSCVQRTYALPGEEGLVLCSWPHGGRPKVPFIYSDEVWAGVEYTVAAHLIREGLTEEGLRLVRAVRARYDGRKRDPFCEVECGNYYVRSMASYGLLPALSGYGYDLTEGTIWFAPKVNREDFRCFFSNGKEWGIYRQTVRQDGTLDRRTEVLYGSEEGIRLKG